MRWNRPLTVGAAVSTLVLMAASAHAQSGAPTRPGVAAAHRYVESAAAWAKRGTVAASRPLATAARYVNGALSSAGRETEIGTQQAWTTATHAVRRGLAKLGKVVGGA